MTGYCEHGNEHSGSVVWGRFLSSRGSVWISKSLCPLGCKFVGWLVSVCKHFKWLVMTGDDVGVALRR